MGCKYPRNYGIGLYSEIGVSGWDACLAGCHAEFAQSRLTPASVKICKYGTYAKRRRRCFPVISCGNPSFTNRAMVLLAEANPISDVTVRWSSSIAVSSQASPEYAAKAALCYKIPYLNTVPELTD